MIIHKWPEQQFLTEGWFFEKLMAFFRLAIWKILSPAETLKWPRLAKLFAQQAIFLAVTDS